jgi:hypothetical protein
MRDSKAKQTPQDETREATNNQIDKSDTKIAPEAPEKHNATKELITFTS